jgi:O-methyltransferase
MSWRYNLLHHLKYNSRLTDVYEFGVYTGQSMVDISTIFYYSNIPIRHFYGFDSFCGLPEETKEPIWQECWKAGEFDARKHFNAKNVEECVECTKQFLRDNSYHKNTYLIPGFYEDTLKNDLMEKYSFMPAIYVDIDTDIYSSTVTVLDFMLSNRLIVPGTIVGFDDWGGSPGWETASNGQSRAWKEAKEKHNLKDELLFQIGNSFPHVHVAYRVI